MDRQRQCVKGGWPPPGLDRAPQRLQPSSQLSLQPFLHFGLDLQKPLDKDVFLFCIFPSLFSLLASMSHFSVIRLNKACLCFAYYMESLCLEPSLGRASKLKSTIPSWSLVTVNGHHPRSLNHTQLDRERFCHTRNRCEKGREIILNLNRIHRGRERPAGREGNMLKIQYMRFWKWIPVTLNNVQLLHYSKGRRGYN